MGDLLWSNTHGELKHLLFCRIPGLPDRGNQGRDESQVWLWYSRKFVGVESTAWVRPRFSCAVTWKAASWTPFLRYHEKI